MRLCGFRTGLNREQEGGGLKTPKNLRHHLCMVPQATSRESQLFLKHFQTKMLQVLEGYFLLVVLSMNISMHG